MTAMKTKLAPRHIVPVVCYSLLLVGFALIAFLAFTFNFAGLEDVNLDIGKPIEFFYGMLAVSFAMFVKLALIIVSIGGAVFALLSLIFSSINIKKHGRKLTVVCLVFDILWCNILLGGMLALLAAFETFALLIVAITCLALCILALVMNILNIKYNEPKPELTAESQNS
jgi:hypothetical protein